jgi:hypothetical protein
MVRVLYFREPVVHLSAQFLFQDLQSLASLVDYTYFEAIRHIARSQQSFSNPTVAVSHLRLF